MSHLIRALVGSMRQVWLNKTLLPKDSASDIDYYWFRYYWLTQLKLQSQNTIQGSMRQICDQIKTLDPIVTLVTKDSSDPCVSSLTQLKHPILIHTHVGSIPEDPPSPIINSVCGTRYIGSPVYFVYWFSRNILGIFYAYIYIQNYQPY